VRRKKNRGSLNEGDVEGVVESLKVFGEPSEPFRGFAVTDEIQD